MSSLDLYEVKFSDRDAAKLIYRELTKYHKELGVLGYSLENYRTKSKRSRNRLKIIFVFEDNKAQEIQSILSGLRENLKEHPLYNYLSFDTISSPMIRKYNFDSYDDPAYQKIFILKRQN